MRNSKFQILHSRFRTSDSESIIIWNLESWNLESPHDVPNMRARRGDPTEVDSMDPIELEPLGDRAYLAHFATERAAAGWAGVVRDGHWPGVTDVVLAYRTVAVFAD